MMDVTGKQSTGVTITGDDNTIDITGDMVVDQNSVGAKLSAIAFRCNRKVILPLTVRGTALKSAVVRRQSIIRRKLTVKDQTQSVSLSPGMTRNLLPWVRLMSR